jgi:Zn-dependent protease/CBS domain-containing protein
MSWSLRLVRLWDIEVRIHVTFILILAWAAYFWSAGTGRGLQGALFGVVAMLLLFACVTLHEFAHSWQAMKYGVKVRDITLMPMGGLARMEEIPEEPGQELRIALAGPLVNLAIAAALILVGFALNTRAVISLGDLFAALQNAEWSGMLIYLAMANLALGLFNLIPAFPMDGGRVLRALLAIRMDHNRATQIATRVGQGLALLLGLWGFAIGAWTLILVAIFVWMGAAGERRQTDTKSVLRDATVGQVMTRSPQTIGENEPLERAVELTLTTTQSDFPVTAAGNGRVVGLLTGREVLQGVRSHHEGNPAGPLTQGELVTVASDEPLFEAQRRMAVARVQAVPVLGQDGTLLGLLTERDINEAYQLLASGTIVLPQ